jgi:hypothetical protein
MLLSLLGENLRKKLGVKMMLGLGPKKVAPKEGEEHDEDGDAIFQKRGTGSAPAIGTLSFTSTLTHVECKPRTSAAFIVGSPVGPNGGGNLRRLGVGNLNKKKDPSEIPIPEPPSPDSSGKSLQKRKAFSFEDSENFSEPLMVRPNTILIPHAYYPTSLLPFFSILSPLTALPSGRPHWAMSR